jgi:hypothetical protein
LSGRQRIFRAVAEPIGADMVETHFGDQLRLQWFPFATPFGAPPARTPRGPTRKAGRLSQGFNATRQRRPFLVGYVGSVTNMAQLSLLIIQTEKQRSDRANTICLMLQQSHRMIAVSCLDDSKAALLKKSRQSDPTSA